MEANFKLSITEYKTVAPYKLRGMNIYSVEEAIYIFYNNWKEFSSDFFEDNFIKWVYNEISDINLAEKLNEIKNYDS
ncbi:MAG: hypothetical protein K2L15_03535, partial [Eubacteriales bacterium]|nr:hypothetical protein [Eubacteriales bacterium]